MGTGSKSYIRADEALSHSEKKEVAVSLRDPYRLLSVEESEERREDWHQE